jgi:hypothetical protein
MINNGFSPASYKPFATKGIRANISKLPLTRSFGKYFQPETNQLDRRSPNLAPTKTGDLDEFIFSIQLSLLQNEDFRSKSRHARNFTAGIEFLFRG